METVNTQQISSFISRIERLEEEKKEIQADIKEVYAEAKGLGFDKKALKQIIKFRKMDDSDRAEFEFLVDSYKTALSM